jgi:hypothetical protein
MQEATEYIFIYFLGLDMHCLCSGKSCMTLFCRNVMIFLVCTKHFKKLHQTITINFYSQNDFVLIPSNLSINRKKISRFWFVPWQNIFFLF